MTASLLVRGVTVSSRASSSAGGGGLRSASVTGADVVTLPAASTEVTTTVPLVTVNEPSPVSGVAAEPLTDQVTVASPERSSAPPPLQM